MSRTIGLICGLVLLVCCLQAGVCRAGGFHDQPPMTNAEVERFSRDFPSFKQWMIGNHIPRNAAQPVVDAAGNPSFEWTDAVTPWFKEKEWTPERFFYVMTHCSAGMMLLLHGDRFAGENRPPDMPVISDYEQNLVKLYKDALTRALTGKPE